MHNFERNFDMIKKEFTLTVGTMVLFDSDNQKPVERTTFNEEHQEPSPTRSSTDPNPLVNFNSHIGWDPTEIGGTSFGLPRNIKPIFGSESSESEIVDTVSPQPMNQIVIDPQVTDDANNPQPMNQIGTPQVVQVNEDDISLVPTEEQVELRLLSSSPPQSQLNSEVSDPMVFSSDGPEEEANSVPNSLEELDRYYNELVCCQSSPLGLYIHQDEPICAWDKKVPTCERLDMGRLEREEMMLIRMLYAYMRSPRFRTWFNTKKGMIVNPFFLKQSLACLDTEHWSPDGKKAVALLCGDIQGGKTDQIMCLFFWAYRVGNFLPVGYLHDSCKESQVKEWQKRFDMIRDTAKQMSKLLCFEKKCRPVRIKRLFGTTVISRSPSGSTGKQEFPSLSNMCSAIVLADLCLAPSLKDLRSLITEYNADYYPDTISLFIIHDEADEVQSTYHVTSKKGTEREKKLLSLNQLSDSLEGSCLTYCTATPFSVQAPSNGSMLFHKCLMEQSPDYKDFMRDIIHIDVPLVDDMTRNKGDPITKFLPPLTALFKQVEAENGAYSHKNILINCAHETKDLDGLVDMCSNLAVDFTKFVAFSVHSKNIVFKFPKEKGDQGDIKLKEIQLTPVDDDAFWKFTTSRIATFTDAYDKAISVFETMWPNQPIVTICVTGKMADRCITAKPTSHRYLTINIVTL